MTNIKLKNGFKCKVDERILSDWRFVKLIADVEKGDQAKKLVATANLVEMLLGKDEEKLVALISKKNDGFVPQEEVYHSVIEIIEAMKEEIEASKKSFTSPE